MIFYSFFIFIGSILYSVKIKNALWMQWMHLNKLYINFKRLTWDWSEFSLPFVMYQCVWIVGILVLTKLFVIALQKSYKRKPNTYQMIAYTRKREIVIKVLQDFISDPSQLLVYFIGMVQIMNKIGVMNIIVTISFMIFQMCSEYLQNHKMMAYQQIINNTIYELYDQQQKGMIKSEDLTSHTMIIVKDGQHLPPGTCHFDKYIQAEDEVGVFEAYEETGEHIIKLVKPQCGLKCPYMGKLFSEHDAIIHFASPPNQHQLIKNKHSYHLVDDLLPQSTLSSILFMLFSIFMIASASLNDQYIKSFNDLVYLIIAVMIAFNIIIPVFRLTLLYILFINTIRFKYPNIGIKFSMVERIHQEAQKPYKLLLTDKTGTLTTEFLKVYDMKIMDIKEEDEEYNPPGLLYALLLANNDVRLNSNYDLLSTSPEETQIAQYLEKKYKVYLKHVTQKRVVFVHEKQQYSFKRHVKLPFSYDRHGTHTCIEFQKQLYHVYCYGFDKVKSVLNNVLEQQLLDEWDAQYKKRALAIAYRPLKSIQEFHDTIDNMFINQNQTSWFSLTAAVFFKNDLQTQVPETIQHLKNENKFVVWMLTGDKGEGPKVIAQQAGILENDHSFIIDASDFILNYQDQKEEWTLKIQQGYGGVILRASDEQKRKIAQLLLDTPAIHDTTQIVFVGDGPNDIAVAQEIENHGQSFSVGVGDRQLSKISTFTITDFQWLKTLLNNVEVESVIGSKFLYTHMNFFNFVIAGLMLIGIHVIEFHRYGVVFDHIWSVTGMLAVSNIYAFSLVQFSLWIAYKLQKYRHMKWHVLEHGLRLIGLMIGLLMGFIIKELKENSEYGNYVLAGLLASSFLTFVMIEIFI